MRRRWLSRRALLLHLALVVTVSGCLVAGWWQVHRAMAGNTLSYGYAVEWPVFAIIACVFWWQLIHGAPKAADDRQTYPTRPEAATAPTEPERRRELESPALQAYNDRLAALAATGKAKTWRNPRGLP